MSANFETGFVGSNRPAWHGLATVIPGTLSLEEAWRQAGLDWEVELRPVYTDGQELADYRAVRRTTDGSVFGIVGDRYEPIQNIELFRVMESLLEVGIQFETAGALFGGRLVWALAKTDGFVDAVTGDQIAPYLMLSSGHDGGWKFRGDLTPTRVVCWNTLKAAIANAKRSFAIKHRSGWFERVAAAKKILGMAHDVFGQLQRDLAHLATVELGTRAPVIVDRLIPVPDTKLKGYQRDRLLEDRANLAQLIAHPTGDTVPGTLYQAWNGISEFSTHYVVPRRRVGTDQEQAERRMFDLSFDSGQRSEFADRGWKVVAELAHA